MSFNSPGCIPVSRSILALPRTDCAANSYACFLGIPSATAASARASRKRNTYAGELPLTPVTVSIRYSGTTSARPKLFRRVKTSCSSSSVTRSLAQTPVIPSPTSAGVFGMVRINFVGFPISVPSHCKDLPGRIDTIIFSGEMKFLTRFIIFFIWFGFTARNTRSDPATTASLSIVAWTPNWLVKRSTLFSVRTDTRMSSADTTPFWIIPPIMALAMLPPPIKPTFMSVRLRMPVL